MGQDNSGDFGGAPAEDAGPSAVVHKKKQVEKLSTVTGEAGPSNAQKKGREKEILRLCLQRNVNVRLLYIRLLKRRKQAYLCKF